MKRKLVIFVLEIISVIVYGFCLFRFRFGIVLIVAFYLGGRNLRGGGFYLRFLRIVVSLIVFIIRFRSYAILLLFRTFGGRVEFSGGRVEFSVGSGDFVRAWRVI